jgi:hypothetical protein
MPGNDDVELTPPIKVGRHLHAFAQRSEHSHVGGAYLPARDGCKITAWEGIVHPSPLEGTTAVKLDSLKL